MPAAGASIGQVPRGVWNPGRAGGPGVEYPRAGAPPSADGQVHRGVWHDGRPVAVKVQYPGADDALRSDLRQIGRLSKVFAPLAGGMDVKPLVEELTARVGEELDYTIEAASQQQAAE